MFGSRLGLMSCWARSGFKLFEKVIKCLQIANLKHICTYFTEAFLKLKSAGCRTFSMTLAVLGYLKSIIFKHNFSKDSVEYCVSSVNHQCDVSLARETTFLIENDKKI